MTSNSLPVVAERMERPAAGSVDTLEASVAMLKANALTGTIQSALRGRNVGILCEDPQRPEVFLLQRAASELGARVALVRAGPGDAGPLLAREQAGRVLGRLYDVLICVDIPPQVVQELRNVASVPAISDLAGEWIALLARRQDAGDAGRYLLQALLISLCA